MVDTELISNVDAEQLEEAYIRCNPLFAALDSRGRVKAEMILRELNAAAPELNQDDILDLFRRLCLLVQVVGDVDANWSRVVGDGSRPDILPSALFALVSTETAFESSEGDDASVFFARDILEDAYALFRPN